MSVIECTFVDNKLEKETITNSGVFLEQCGIFPKKIKAVGDSVIHIELDDDISDHEFILKVLKNLFNGCGKVKVSWESFPLIININ